MTSGWGMSMTGGRRRTVTVMLTLLVAVSPIVVSRPPSAEAGSGGVTAVTAPRSGKDPATSAQTGLAAAMGHPTPKTTVAGTLVRVGRGANIVDTGRTREKPVRTESVNRLAVSPKSLFRDVFDSPTAAGGGCRSEYGAPGQCLPRVPPSQAVHAAHGMPVSEVWSCAEVRTLFATGLPMRTAGGADPLRLDTNKDGTACGTGD